MIDKQIKKYTNKMRPYLKDIIKSLTHRKFN